MSIIPDETLIVDQASVNGNENDHEDDYLDSEDSEPEADEDWGDIRRPPKVPPRWQDIGAYAAERHLKDSVVVLHDDASGEDLTWQLRNGQLWELAPNDRAPIAERLLVLQHQIVEELRAAGSAKAATRVAQAGFADQVRGKVTPFWAGANVVLRKRPLADPPAHLLNTPDGVRDLKSRPDPPAAGDALPLHELHLRRPRRVHAPMPGRCPDAGGGPARAVPPRCPGPGQPAEGLGAGAGRRGRRAPSGLPALADRRTRLREGAHPPGLLRTPAAATAFPRTLMPS